MAVDSEVGYNDAKFNFICCKYSQSLEKNCYPKWIRVSIIHALYLAQVM